MAKKNYIDDYETIVTTDERGHEKTEVVYRGGYYEVSLDDKGILNFRRTNFLLLVIVIILHVGGGFVSNPGMYQFYVALPYVFAFFPLVYFVAGILRLPTEKRQYRRDEIGLSYDRMKTASTVLFIILLIGILGELAYLMVETDRNQPYLELIYLTLEVLAVVSVYLIIRLQRKTWISALE